VFNDFETAERARTELVRDGFPTDRVEPTAYCEPGRAGLEPADSLHDKFAQYFRTLFTAQEEQRYADLLAERVERGVATITVHPRGAIETSRATEIFESVGSVEVAKHDLENQTLERAAGRQESPWIRHFWLEPGKSDCIYCRLFETGSD